MTVVVVVMMMMMTKRDGDDEGDDNDDDKEEEEWDSRTASRSDGVHLQNRISLLSTDTQALTLGWSIVMW